MAAALPPSSPPRSIPALLASLVLHALAVLLLAWRPSVPASEREQEPALSVEIVTEAPKAPAPSSPSPGEAPKPIPNLDPAPLASSGRVTSAVAAAPAKPTRSERDLVLSQVVRHWKPPPELSAFTDAEFAVTVTVLADGTLAPPFGMRLPYDPGAAIDGWNKLHPDDPARRGSESFYRALRQAQPLKLPPALAAKAPFTVRLDFRVRDVKR